MELFKFKILVTRNANDPMPREFTLLVPMPHPNPVVLHLTLSQSFQPMAAQLSVNVFNEIFTPIALKYCGGVMYMSQ